MANENIQTNNGTENSEVQRPHESFIHHMVEEIKEEIAELAEETRDMGDDFPMLGNGHVNHVHDHHHDGEPKKEENQKEG